MKKIIIVQLKNLFILCITLFFVMPAFFIHYNRLRAMTELSSILSPYEPLATSRQIKNKRENFFKECNKSRVLQSNLPDDLKKMLIYGYFKKNIINQNIGGINKIALSNDNQFCALGLLNGSTVIYRQENNQFVLHQEIPAHDYWTHELSFFYLNQHYLLICSVEKLELYIYSYDQLTKNSFKEHQTIPGLFTSFTLSPQADTLALVTEDGCLRVYSWQNDKFIPENTYNTDKKEKIRSAFFSPCQEFLIMILQNNVIKIYNFLEKKLILLQELTHQESSHFFTCMAFSQDSQLIFSADNAGFINIWEQELSSKRFFHHQTITDETTSIYSVALSPDTKLLAYSSSNNKVKILFLDDNRYYLPAQKIDVHNHFSLIQFLDSSELLVCSHLNFIFYKSHLSLLPEQLQLLIHLYQNEQLSYDHLSEEEKKIILSTPQGAWPERFLQPDTSTISASLLDGFIDEVT